jgi:hypothetical protein
MIIDCSLLTVPTPTPYSAEEPLKNVSDLCYVGLQILTQLKANAVQWEVSLSDIKDALRLLSYSGKLLELGNLTVNGTAHITDLLNT